MTMKYGNLRFYNGRMVFSDKDFKILFDNIHNSYKLQWKKYVIPLIGGMGYEHLDCLSTILQLAVTFHAKEPDGAKIVGKGVSRFMISHGKRPIKAKPSSLSSHASLNDDNDDHDDTSGNIWGQVP